METVILSLLFGTKITTWLAEQRFWLLVRAIISGQQIMHWLCQHAPRFA